MQIFIGCSSRNEIPKYYLELAKKVGNLLKEEHLIIGGSTNGMMGKVIEDVPSTNITQIILKDYLSKETINSNQTIICETSFERVKNIWERADILVLLPGGIGTLSEIMNFLEENRTKEKKKKIIILNVQNYYNDIIDFIKAAQELQFCDSNILEGLTLVTNLQELKEQIKK